jgi:hypothetical protein
MSNTAKCPTCGSVKSWRVPGETVCPNLFHDGGTGQVADTTEPSEVSRELACGCRWDYGKQSEWCKKHYVERREGENDERRACFDTPPLAAPDALDDARAIVCACTESTNRGKHAEYCDKQTAAIARLTQEARTDELERVQIYTDPKQPKGISPFRQLQAADKHINARLAELNADLKKRA